MQELELFQNWVDNIVHPITNRKGYYATDVNASDFSPGYTTTVIIEQLSRLSSKGGEVTSGTAPKLTEKARFKTNEELYEKQWQSYKKKNEVSSKWTLFEAFPRQVDPIQLDYGTNDTVMSMNVTLTYRTFTADFNPFTMEQYPLTTDQIYARDELGQKSGNRGTMSDMFPNMKQG